MLKQFARLAHALLQNVVIYEPKATRDERSFITGDAIDGRTGVIAGYKTTFHQMLFNGRHGSQYTRVVSRKEADQRQHQKTCVEFLTAVKLHKRIQFFAEAETAHFFLNIVSQFDPALKRTFFAKFLNGPDCSIDRDPGHHFGFDEMPRFASDFPHAFVRFGPKLFQPRDKRTLQIPRRFEFGQSSLSRVVEGIEHFAIYVKLQLFRCAVADAHWAGTFVTR